MPAPFCFLIVNESTVSVDALIRLLRICHQLPNTSSKPIRFSETLVVWCDAANGGSFRSIETRSYVQFVAVSTAFILPYPNYLGLFQVNILYTVVFALFAVPIVLMILEKYIPTLVLQHKHTISVLLAFWSTVVSGLFVVLFFFISNADYRHRLCI